MSRTSRRTLAFNAATVASAKATAGKQTEYRIDRCPGLVLLVQPSGSAAFYFVYAVKLNGKATPRRLLLGKRGVLTLEQAKKAANKTSVAVANGGDPVGDARAMRTSATFEAVARDLLASETLAPETATGYRYVYEADIWPVIGALPLAGITTAHVEGVIKKVTARGSRANADRVKFAIASVFKYAKRHCGYQGANPARGLPNQSSMAGRKRPISDVELMLLLAEMGRDALTLGTGQIVTLASPAIRRALMLTLLTGCRRSEVAEARVSELDLDRALWVIPGETQIKGKTVRGRTKNQVEKIVPLSKQAVALFREALADAGSSAVVFPGTGQHFDTIDPKSCSRAMTRLLKRAGIDGARLHDFRASVRTKLRDWGYSREVRDAVLGHLGLDVGSKHYEAPSAMFIEGHVRPALQRWADHVDGLRAQENTIGKVPIAAATVPLNVVPLVLRA